MRIRGLQPESIARLLLKREPAIDVGQPLRVFYSVCDHYEPKFEGAPPTRQQERVAAWRNTLPTLMAPFQDSRGQSPQHTFFYPEEEYERPHLNAIGELCELGLGEVEIHLHHDNDTSAGVREKLTRFTELLHREHGMLHRRPDGRLSYGFIHGDWALDNSHPEGKHCGVNDELDILRETGCYADFTLPAAPSPAQTVTVNSIYYATDDPGQPKSHDRGVAAAVGATPPDKTLLMVQGPLMVDWSDRIRGLIPRIDYCNLQGARGATLARLLRWVRTGVIVRGQPNWRFVKVHTHGCEEGNQEVLLGEPMARFHKDLAEYAAKTPGFEYYYVTAREMAGLVHQAELGYQEPVFPTALIPDHNLMQSAGKTAVQISVDSKLDSDSSAHCIATQ